MVGKFSPGKSHQTFVPFWLETFFDYTTLCGKDLKKEDRLKKSCC